MRMIPRPVVIPVLVRSFGKPFAKNGFPMECHGEGIKFINLKIGIPGRSCKGYRIRVSFSIFGVF